MLSWELDRDGYAVVVPELNRMYDSRLKGGGPVRRVPIRNHMYTVEACGEGEYGVIGREELK